MFGRGPVRARVRRASGTRGSHVHVQYSTIHNGGRTADPIRSHPPRPLRRPNHKTTARSTVSALAALEHDTAIGMPDADPFAPNAEDFADFADFGSPPVFEANLDAVPNSGPPATQTFEANFDEVAPAIVATSPAQHHPAAPASVAPNEQDDDDAQRREFEERRQKRLAQLEEAKKAAVPIAPAPAASSWGGWLSSMPTASLVPPSAMLQRMASDAEKAKARLASNVASATANLTSAASVLQSPTSGLETIAELRERAASAATAASEALQKNTEKIQLQSPVASLTKTLDGLSTAARAMPSMPISMASLGGSAQNLSLSSLSTSFVDASQWSRLGALSSASNGENDVTVDVSGADAYGEEEEEDSTAARTSAVPSGKSDQPPEKAKKKKTEEERLDAYLAAGKLEKAAQYAANSPKQELRTLATLAKFEAAAPKPAASSDTQQQQQQGQAPILLYFGALLKRNGALTEEEGLALARPVVQQGQLALLTKWVTDGKIAKSVALADIIREKDPAAAIPMYRECGAPEEKCIQCYAELGDIEEVRYLSSKLSPPQRDPDWAKLLGDILASSGGLPHAIHLEAKLRALPPPPPPPDPEDELAVMAYNMDPPPAPPPSRLECADIFLSRGALQHATKLALDAAAASELPAESISPNDGFVTRLLDANLRADRQIGGALLEAGAFALGSFDASLVGGTCEAVGLHTQAMRLHSQPEAIARVLCHPSIGEDAASARVGQMGAADGLVVLTALLRANTPPAQQKALAIARAQWSVLSHTAVVSAYESAQAETGLLMYLSARMAKTTDDPDLTLTYLRVCRRAGRGDEVERITRDRAIAYEPRAVLELLQEPLPPPALGGQANPPGIDPRPIINVCDRFDMAAEMAALFHAQGNLKHLQLYVQRINPASAPQVCGGLLDAGAAPELVASMLTKIDASELAKDASLAPRLISACEERGQLPLLQPWLTSRAEELPPGTLEEGGIYASVREALQKVAPRKGLFGW